jgi:hypothetical protein
MLIGWWLVHSTATLGSARITCCIVVTPVRWGYAAASFSAFFCFICIIAERHRNLSPFRLRDNLNISPVSPPDCSEIDCQSINSSEFGGTNCSAFFSNSLTYRRNTGSGQRFTFARSMAVCLRSLSPFLAPASSSVH